MSESDTEIIVRDEQPAELVAHAGDAAKATRAIVEATAQAIGGRKYVRVEGWQAIALAHGCITSSRDVRRIETGFAAIGEVRRRDTGAVLATAEGFVGDDEGTWARRPEYARRAMAQTRAISRACRAAFAHVVVMMGAGLETTPAEEMEDTKRHLSPRPLRAWQAATGGAACGQVIDGAYDIVEGQLIRVVRKEGAGKRGPWVRWGCLIGRADGTDDWYGTFDASLGEAAEMLDGQHVIVRYATEEVAGKPRHNIISIESAPSEASDLDLPEELV